MARISRSRRTFARIDAALTTGKSSSALCCDTISTANDSSRWTHRLNSISSTSAASTYAVSGRSRWMSSANSFASKSFRDISARIASIRSAGTTTSSNRATLSISGARASRRSGESFFESRTFICRNATSVSTATPATTRGPRTGPRPASSTPTITAHASKSSRAVSWARATTSASSTVRTTPSAMRIWPSTIVARTSLPRQL